MGPPAAPWPERPSPNTLAHEIRVPRALSDGAGDGEAMDLVLQATIPFEKKVQLCKARIHLGQA
jgi:hypothetical protein